MAGPAPRKRRPVAVHEEMPAGGVREYTDVNATQHYWPEAEDAAPRSALLPIPCLKGRGTAAGAALPFTLSTEGRLWPCPRSVPAYFSWNPFGPRRPADAGSTAGVHLCIVQIPGNQPSRLRGCIIRAEKHPHRVRPTRSHPAYCGCDCPCPTCSRISMSGPSMTATAGPLSIPACSRRNAWKPGRRCWPARWAQSR
ncbi:hypothetical protein D9M69_557480 [compost metagenome]